MLLTKGDGPVTSSYIGSLPVDPSALCNNSWVALIFALLLLKVRTIAVVETTTQTIRAVAREVVDIR